LRYVVDCSVAVKWFVRESLSDRADSALDQFMAGDIALVAPESIVAELGHALRKCVLSTDPRRKISPEESHAFVDEFLVIGIETVPIAPLASQAMRLTTQFGVTFFDALYIALALRDDLTVLTADAPMTRAFAPLDRTLHLADFKPS
jgi:predicted nucleic acid-binding protein